MTRTKYITDQQFKELNEYISEHQYLVTIYEDYNNIIANIIEQWYNLDLTRENNMQPDFTKIKINKKSFSDLVLNQQQLIDKLHEYILIDDEIREGVIIYNYNHNEEYYDYNEFKTQFDVDNWVKNNIKMICPYNKYMENQIISEDKYNKINKKIRKKCEKNVIYKILLNANDILTRNIYATKLYEELNKNIFETEVFKILYFNYNNNNKGYYHYTMEKIYSRFTKNIEYCDFSSLNDINELFPYSVQKLYTFDVNNILFVYDEDRTTLLNNLIHTNFKYIIGDIIINNSFLINELKKVTYHKNNIIKLELDDYNFNIDDDVLNYNHSIDNIYQYGYNELSYDNDNRIKFLKLFQLCQNHYYASFLNLSHIDPKTTDLYNDIALMFIISNIPKNDSKLFTSMLYQFTLSLTDISDRYIEMFQESLNYNSDNDIYESPIEKFIFRGGQLKNYNIIEKMINLILKISTLITIVVILVYLFRIVRNIVHITHDEPKQVQHLQRKKQLVEVSSMNNAVNKYEIDNPNNLTIYDYVSHDIKNITTNE